MENNQNTQIKNNQPVQAERKEWIKPEMIEMDVNVGITVGLELLVLRS